MGVWGDRYEQLRVVQVKCKRCPDSVLGGVMYRESLARPELSVYLTGAQRLAALGVIRFDLWPLDPDRPTATARFDCENPSHGSANVTFATLLDAGREGLRKIRENRRGAPKSVVLRVEAHRLIP